jgi:hypothetical protein
MFFPFVDLRKKDALIVNELKALNRRLESLLLINNFNYNVSL